jgi:hypothetical protein
MKLPRWSALFATAALALAIYPPATARAGDSESARVAFDDQKGVSHWFGRLATSGEWCALDNRSMKRHQKDQDLDEIGWARFDGNRLKSLTYAREDEGQDSYVEDRYFVGPRNVILRMVRTGHYINDPVTAVTFAPGGHGELALTAASKRRVQNMVAAKEETYWVDWEAFSRLDQIPFAKLAAPHAPAPASGC